MEQAREIAIGRMVEDAKSKGANAIICVRLQSSDFTKCKGGGQWLVILFIL